MKSASLPKIVSDQEGNIRNAMEEQAEGSRLTLEGVTKMRDVTSKVQTDSAEMHKKANDVIHESKNLENATKEITERGSIFWQVMWSGLRCKPVSAGIRKVLPCAQRQGILLKNHFDPFGFPSFPQFVLDPSL